MRLGVSSLILSLLLQEPKPTKIASPLPGGIAAVVRFLFNLPQWFQAVGFVVGVIVAVIALVMLWRRRGAIATWYATRKRQVRLALIMVIVLVVAGATAFGTAG